MGVIAAVSVTVLVNAMRMGQNRAVAEGPAQKTVLVATQDIEPATLVRADAVATTQVAEREAPAGFMSSPVQMVGKILSRPMVKGEVFTEECVATERHGQFLAGILEPGMRLFSLTLNKAESVAGLLYVGCKVDVLASYGRTQSQKATHRILEDVEVVAIEEQAITSPKGSEPKLGRVSSRLNVTLMLTVEQAEKLQSAKNQASIALAMRNPQETPGLQVPGEEGSPVAAGTHVGPQTRVWVMELIRAGENETKEFSEEVYGTTP
jgi:Flp pilus assembly protein CpaB